MLWKIFFSALAIRWSYALALYITMGLDGITGTDSLGYLSGAEFLARKIASGSLSGFQWLGEAGDQMPLFQWIVGLCAVASGKFAPLTYVLLQGIIDACTCLLIYKIASLVAPRVASWAAIAAVINPTQIVLSGLVYTDTPFLFLVALFLFAAAHWLRTPELRWAILIGISIGAASLVRALAAPFTPLLLAYLLVISAARGRFSLQILGHLTATCMLFLVCIGPVVYRNATVYGTWSLTPQGGVHLALWVVPLLKETKDGTPWQRSYDEIQELVRERFPDPSSDAFVQSGRYLLIAREQLTQIGIGTVVKAWLTGAVINLAAPAIILSPPVAHLPHRGFFATSGATSTQKIINYLFHSEGARYGWFLIIGIIGVMIMRVIQLAGSAVILHPRQLPILGLFGLWTVYILVVNGPIASPKYRLPIEPPLMVFAGAGLLSMGKPKRVRN